MKKVVIDDVEYESIAALARAYNKSYKSLARRYAAGKRGKELIAPTGNKIKLIVDDVEYESISALARAYNKSCKNLARRYAMGIRGKELIAPTRNKIKLIVDDVEYESIAALARAYNEPYTNVLRRYAAGKRGKELIIPTYKNTRRRDTIVIEGKEFQNLIEVWQHYNTEKYQFSYSTLVKRYRLGVRGNELVKELERPIVDVDEVIDGTRYTSLKKVAEDFGLSQETVVQRYKKGCRGKELVVRLNGNRVEVRGVEYKSIADLESAFDIPYHVLLERHRRGKRGEDLIAPVKKKVFTIIDGIEYESMEAVAKAYNISPSTLRSRYYRYGYRGKKLVQLDKSQKRPNVSSFFPMTIDDITYEKFSDLVKASGYSEYTLSKKILDGVRGPELFKKNKKNN